ncbi:MAG TPA: hypothetical protein VKB57_09735 [Acidimicrobiales bacterium]|nr:hypothetical protein [Acidimicrobiales bacterium]
MGRRTAVVCALLAGLLGLAAGADPAGADPPTITVTPTSIDGGDHVQVKLTGMGGGGILGLFTCATEDLNGSEPPPMGLLQQRCSNFQIVIPVPPPVDGVVTLDYVPAEAWSVSAGDGSDPERRRCGVAPADCAVVAFDPTLLVSTPPATFTTTPSPLLVLPATVREGDGMDVLVAGTPQATQAVAQCTLPVASTLAASTCGPTTQVALGDGGLGEGRLTPTAEVGGVSCAADGANHCAIASFDPGGAHLATREISVAATPPPPPLEIQVSRTDEEIRDGDSLTVTVTGPGLEPVWVGECAASVADTGDVDTGPCTDVVSATAGFPPLIPPTPIQATAHETFTGADGTAVDCTSAPDACVYAVESQAADDPGFATAPLPFDLPDVITVAPTEGLLDGATVAIDALGLVRVGQYTGLVCEGVHAGDELPRDLKPCDPDSSRRAFAGPDGALHLVVPVHQRFTDDVGVTRTCREGCQVVLVAGNAITTLGVTSVTPIAMAEGTIAAAPSTGLADGQAVTVTGSQLMPSYDGPTLLFPTGGWALVQCDAGLLDDPTLLGVFTQCGGVDLGAPLQVTGPDLTASAGVHATLHRFLGDTSDCTAGPGTCLLVLARWEQDATVTLHTAPISFG